jgi:undecaprenyl diphosphate synthase
MQPKTDRGTFFTTQRGRELLTRLDTTRVPSHVAIIMDGNGRWAEGQGLPRVAGHRAGAKAVEEAIGAAIEIGARYLTIYSFSTENWRRPATEVADLMGLFVEVINAKMSDLQQQGVRVRVIGRLDEMRPATAEAFRSAMAQTAGNTTLDLVVAVNYGGRGDLTDAVRAIAAEATAGSLTAADVEEELVAAHLSTAGIPEPDVLVRTAGERRLSNFLLWESAYTELYFTDRLWPDFDRDDFLELVVDYQGRERRFGGR